MSRTVRDDLRDEWLLLQKQYEDFDQRALTLKGLSTPLLGAGYAAGVKDGAETIVLATMMVAACLWALETMWKMFQYSLTDRIKALEDYFRDPDSCQDYKPFQVFTSWGQSFARDKMNWYLWRERSLLPFVMLPYAPMLVAGIIIIAGMMVSGGNK